MADLRARFETDEDEAQIQALAFILWVQGQLGTSSITRVHWADAKHGEQTCALQQAARELGYK